MTTTFIRIYNNDDSDGCATGIKLLLPRRRSVTIFTHTHIVSLNILLYYTIYMV